MLNVVSYSSPFVVVTCPLSIDVVTPPFITNSKMRDRYHRHRHEGDPERLHHPDIQELGSDQHAGRGYEVLSPARG